MHHIPARKVLESIASNLHGVLSSIEGFAIIVHTMRFLLCSRSSGSFIPLQSNMKPNNVPKLFRVLYCRGARTRGGVPSATYISSILIIYYGIDTSDSYSFDRHKDMAF